MTTSDDPGEAGPDDQGNAGAGASARDLGMELVPVAPTFDAAFDELARIAYRVAYRILGDREESRDVVQESLARAYVRWARVHDIAQPWVSRVSANLALDIVRRRARKPDLEGLVPSGDAGDAVADRLELALALKRLSKRQREVVILRYVADLSERDVAQLLGCSPGTVKRHAHRGLAALRLSLRPGQLPDLPAGPTDLPAGPTDLEVVP